MSERKTLSEMLGLSATDSALLRKAERLGLYGVDALLSLAVLRGCRHYAAFGGMNLESVPDRNQLSDDELVVLLIHGSHPFTPVAIRCAAQLIRSNFVDPERLSTLARLEQADKVLGHIASAGMQHDSDDKGVWARILANLPASASGTMPNLPHWTRFVSMPGIQRRGKAPIQWLIPTP